MRQTHNKKIKEDAVKLRPLFGRYMINVIYWEIITTREFF
jgi:hypothetical protein